MSDVYEHRFGRHLIRSESKNLYYVKFVGDVTPEDTAVFFSTAAPDRDLDKPLGLLVDLRELGSVRPRANDGHRPSASKETTYIAYVGATFPIRVMTTMFINAVQFLARRKWNVYEFFDDEEKAREWLHEKLQTHVKTDE